VNTLDDVPYGTPKQALSQAPDLERAPKFSSPSGARAAKKNHEGQPQLHGRSIVAGLVGVNVFTLCEY
jgi:hypothetical protein